MMVDVVRNPQKRNVYAYEIKRVPGTWYVVLASIAE